MNTDAFFGGGDVHVSATNAPRFVSRLRRSGLGRSAFPTLTRGVRNVSRLRRLNRPRSGRTDANRRASAFPRESCGKLRENSRLRRRRTFRERPSLRAVRLLRRRFLFYRVPAGRDASHRRPAVILYSPASRTKHTSFCLRQKSERGDVDVSAPKISDWRKIRDFPYRSAG